MRVGQKPRRACLEMGELGVEMRVRPLFHPRTSLSRCSHHLTLSFQAWP